MQQNEAILTYDSSTGTKSQTLIAKISISSHEFLINSCSISTDFVIGINHVKHIKLNSKFPICCSSISKLQKLAAAVSQEATLYWSISYIELVKNQRSEIKDPKVHFFTFKSENIAMAAHQVNDARRVLGYLNSHKKILFLANPFSGTNKAIKVYHQIVEPLLILSGLHSYHDLIKTQHQNHAVEIASSLNTSLYRAAVTISGDGVYHEFINGLLSRPDWKEASKLPLGCIAAGSCNAIGQNLDISNPILATLAVFKGLTSKMDVIMIIQNGLTSYTHLSLFWALVADIDIESERFRKLGGFLRNILMAIIRVINFRSYHGKVYMLTQSEAPSFELPNSVPSSSGPTSKYINTSSYNYNNWPLQIESRFQYFTALNLPWIAVDFLACPLTKLNNGLIDILLTEKVSRASIIGALLDCERGASMMVKGIQHYRVKALVLEPGGYSESSQEKDTQADLLEEGKIKNLILDASGERVPYTTIQIEVISSAINCIIPSWFDEGKSERNFRKDFDFQAI